MSTQPILPEAERVQEILQGTGAARPVCSQCRVRESDIPGKMLRCARCQVAHYCSATCQKKHFGFHKHSCKRIADLRANVERGSGSLPIGDNEEDRIYETWEIASILSSLGDQLVETAYRETDTIENGSVYYRQALQSYISILPLGIESFFHASNPLEDKVLLLLAVLGAGEDTMREWMQHTKSPRRSYYEVSNKMGDRDMTFLMVCKLHVVMRCIAKYRQDNPEAREDHTMAKELRDLVERIRLNGNGEYLIRLRDKIPLNPEDAPELFRGGPKQNGMPIPREFWLLFQDSFFLTPGLNIVLHEFVPDDE